MFNYSSNYRYTLGLAFLLMATAGCRQMPFGQDDREERPAGVDGTFRNEVVDDTVPIEKELAAPKGFFGKTGGFTGGWSSQSRDIERSLGVN